MYLHATFAIAVSESVPLSLRHYHDFWPIYIFITPENLFKNVALSCALPIFQYRSEEYEDLHDCRLICLVARTAACYRKKITSFLTNQDQEFNSGVV